MAGEISLKDVPDDFSQSFLNNKPTLRQKQRAVAFVKDAYIKSVKLFRGENENSIQITAKIFRRKSEDPHRVNLDVNITGKSFNDAHYSCKAGVSGQCAHVLAVINALEQWKISGYKEIPSEPSSTSLPQQWDKPRGEKIKAKPVSKMIISRPTNLNRKRKPVIASYIDTRKTDINIDDIEKLKILKQSSKSYLVTSTANCTVDTPLGVQFIGSALSYHAPLIQPIANPPAAWSCGDTEFPKALAPCDLQCVEQLAHEWSNLNITQSDANALERSTRLQSSDPRWYTERSKRITASNFGLIMRRKKDISETFMKNTF